jgi:hypothetical protein
MKTTENQDYIGSAWRALGLAASRANAPVVVVGEAYDAARCFAESLRIYTGMGAEAERARTLRAWARHEQESGDAERGAALWEEARAVFSRLKMGRELGRMSSPA